MINLIATSHKMSKILLLIIFLISFKKEVYEISAKWIQRWIFVEGIDSSGDTEPTDVTGDTGPTGFTGEINPFASFTCQYIIEKLCPTTPS